MRMTQKEDGMLLFAVALVVPLSLPACAPVAVKVAIASIAGLYASKFTIDNASIIIDEEQARLLLAVAFTPVMVIFLPMIMVKTLVAMLAGLGLLAALILVFWWFYSEFTSNIASKATDKEYGLLLFVIVSFTTVVPVSCVIALIAGLYAGSSTMTDEQKKLMLVATFMVKVLVTMLAGFFAAWVLGFSKFTNNITSRMTDKEYRVLLFAVPVASFATGVLLHLPTCAPTEVKVAIALIAGLYASSSATTDEWTKLLLAAAFTPVVIQFLPWIMVKVLVTILAGLLAAWILVFWWSFNKFTSNIASRMTDKECGVLLFAVARSFLPLRGLYDRKFISSILTDEQQLLLSALFTDVVVSFLPRIIVMVILTLLAGSWILELWSSKFTDNSNVQSVSDQIEDEAKIHLKIACHFLPVLADALSQEQFTKLQTHFNILIYYGGNFVALKKLTQVYSDIHLKTVKAPELTPCLQKHHSWYFCIDATDKFEAYSESISEKLEEAFVSKEYIIQESISYFDHDKKNIVTNVYHIDTFEMTQTNITTKYKRKISRKESKERVIVLEIRAHPDQISTIKEEVLKILTKAIARKKIPVPRLSDNHPNIREALKIVEDCFVTAEECDDDAIALEGNISVIKDTELLLKDTLLAKSHEMLKQVVARAPDDWEEQHDVLEVKLVNKRTIEWTQIEQHVNFSMKILRTSILRIERIQNQWLWKAFFRSRRDLSEKNNGQINEKCLFHGSGKIPPVKIYNSECGFDNRLSSQGMWGMGTYFAETAKYSNSYAYNTPEGHKQIFLVWVLTGITHKCEPKRDLKVPPKKADHQSMHNSSSMFEDERFDSVNGSSNGSEIFVIYEHGRSYPAYLITYTHH